MVLKTLYNKRGIYESILDRNNPYFGSSNPGSDSSEDEGDPIDTDEVVDLLPRNLTTKIYFEPTIKKILF